MIRILSICLLPLVAFGSLAVAQRGPDAAIGKRLYAEKCASCHGAQLIGGAASQLKGEEFRSKWLRQPSTELFTYITALMPADAPGQLSEQAYADIVEFIAAENSEADKNTERR